MAGHWVVIETASNQAFVFASNKQAVTVGASELIFRSGTSWVRDAVRRVEKDGAAVETVVLASGKALLIVDAVEQGRAIIREVTDRALREAPGLQVWGVVDPEPIGDDAGRGKALGWAYQLHAACRASRPSPLMRAPTLPYVKPCRYSGLPATRIGREGSDWHPRGALVDAAWRRAGAGRARMADALDAERAVLSADLLDRGVSEAGWVAVVHADGNGVGQLFSHLHKVYFGLDYTTKLHDFSAALDEVAQRALKEAVASRQEGADWILPIVIGGDDMTAIMDGRVAFDVTVEFLRRFEQHSAEHPVIWEVVAEVSEKIDPDRPYPDGLTACAGIAFIKPHHPFSDGYDLAEQLCQSAKAVKKLDQGLSALDFHVLHDSVGRDLDQLRVPVTDIPTRNIPAEDRDWKLRLWSGPIVVSGDGEGSPFGQAHHLSRLRAAMEGQQQLGSGAVHRLREALLAGGAAVDHAVQQVSAWADDPGEVAAYLAEHMRVPEPVPPDGPEVDPESRKPLQIRFSRVLDALNLLDMRHGTVEGSQRRIAEVGR